MTATAAPHAGPPGAGSPASHGRVVGILLGAALSAIATGVVSLALGQPALPGAVIAVMTFVAGLALGSAALARERRRGAANEFARLTRTLRDEIESHARTNAELHRAKDAAEAANLAKSRYIVGLSHEIRSPLNAISGYAQLLERDPDRPVADAVRVIRRSATHLADLVDGLIDVSRIENGSVRLARERVNLIELIAQIVDMFRLQAAVRGIQFEHTRPGNLPTYVYTDHKRLRQVLINLISNAIKYTPMGSAALHVLWRNPVAEFVVQDTGVGIDAANHERIFEPFERIGTVAGQPGVGLGLTITRMLVDIMGGQLTVESQPGAGSTFRVKMYLSEAGLDAATRQPHSAAARPGQARRRILAVDDDAAHLELLRHLLPAPQFELEACGSGEEGLAAFRHRRPDLVILDVAMPALDGWEVARRLRQGPGADVPILMVSANVHDFQRPRRPDDPHDDHLVKPYEVDTLLDRVQSLLALESAGGECAS